jgi:hypothetical protein
MVSSINNNRPINTNTTRFYSPRTKYSIPCSARPFCASRSDTSFINKNNKIYLNNQNYIVTQKTIKDNYPDFLLFGTENTLQSIYSADPAKLKIGAF